MNAVTFSLMQRTQTTDARPTTSADGMLDDWLRRARQGDRAAFERLYRHQAGLILAFCIRLVGSREAGEELLQEVFVRAWEHLDSIESASHLQAWLRRVAINLRRSQQRTVARRGHPVELSGDEPIMRSPAPPAGLKRDLERALRELPDGAREVLLLHDVHGYQHQEIAGQLGIAVGTSKAQLHRARKRLRKVLQ